MTAGDGLPVFVINMERDTERRRHMTELLAGLGMQAEFVPAVDGRLLSPAERNAHDPARARRIYGVDMLDSEIGCFLSHYRLYRRMQSENIETALILEDDIAVDPSLPAIVQQILDHDFQDWLVVRLDSKRREVIEPKKPKDTGTLVATLPGGRKMFCLRTQVLGTGAYLIRRQGAERMLSYGKRIFMPIDQTMDRYWENGILPYVVRPFPADQGDAFGSHTPDRGPARRAAQPATIRLRRRLQRWEDSVRKRLFNLARR